jgi:phospholipid/cholesterol/gamma-HCH transport system substrate-binding protein
MKTAERKRSITVGIFVALGILIFLTGVFVLGGKQNKFTRNMHVRSVFPNVGGLRAGNNVWFSGVKIGTVRRIHFLSNSQVEVEMTVLEDAQQYIHKDATASISSDGLIGNRIVVLTGGSPQSPPIEENDRIRSVASLSSDEIMETLQANNKNLLKVTTDFKNIVEKISQGKGTVGAVITDPAVEQSFRNTLSGLESATTSAARASSSLSAFTAKLNTRGALANELVTDTAIFRSLKSSAAKLNQTVNSAQETVASAQQAVTSAQTAVGNVNRATAKLNSNDNALGVLLNDAKLAQDLKTTMNNVGGSSKKLDETLDAAQNNFLLRGYFRKKRKRDEKAREDSLRQAQEAVVK